MTETANENIEKNLQHYLNSKHSSQAILLTGNWGCGKTHFINYFISNNKSEELKLIKVSLFGLHRISEVEDRILGFFYPVMNLKGMKLVGDSIKRIATAIKLEVSEELKAEVSSAASRGSLNLFNLLIEGKSDYALILDDIERSRIPLQDLLGYINHVVETCQIKTILIANEAEFEKGQENDYRKFKEKVISKTFLINHNAENVIDQFLLDDAVNIYEFKKIIVEAYAASDCRNLRSLKQAIDDFSQMWETVDDKFKAHDKYRILLAKTFFSLSMEVKSARIRQQDFTSSNVLKAGTDFTKKYFNSELPIFRENFWTDVLFNGDYSKINSLSESLSFFTKPDTLEPDTLEQLRQFQYLEDDEFIILDRRLNAEITSLGDEQPLQFLRKAELMANLIENNLSEMGVVSLANCISAYPMKHQNSDKWKNCNLNDFIQWEVTYLKKNEKLADSFESFISAHADAFNKEQFNKKQNRDSDKLSSFYTAIKEGDRTTLVKLLYTENRHTVFFTDVDVDRFVSALAEAPNTAIADFIEIASERYVNDRLRPNHGSNELTLELDFWNNACSAIEARLDSVAPLKKYNLQKFIDPTITNFKSLLTPVTQSIQ
ncbi:MULTISPECIES: P-loop NTPase fold protein [unclassified Pseudomonas]|uniref:P-loop NTPase fold protein n=1 Tax=unclassified Pseudomonas TaxID=196821 RepID=UPI002097924D|nr:MULTISPECIES: P-loop NTPase fold protein [unclassified Pseudomonas]MCO7504228.1 KAP family NTPase [Pseudomonas sp. VE 267-6A]MCO7531943.1 KAP family NTPase [Pseudomonas sp. 2]